MKEVSKVIFVFCLNFMVMIKSRYLLIEIDREPHANGVGPQDKDLGEPSCWDGIQNCVEYPDGYSSCEEGIDCGGPCAPCSFGVPFNSGNKYLGYAATYDTYEICDCELKNPLVGVFGCRIDARRPPPKGKMCNCNYYFFFCEGTVVPCIESEDNDCSGCWQCKCCSEEGWTGNCNGYDFVDADAPKCK